MHHYSDPASESDPHKLPDIEVHHLSAEEVVGQLNEFDDDAIIQWLKDHDVTQDLIDYDDYLLRPLEYFPKLCKIVRDKVEGWYYRVCFPGCLPDSDDTGPFDTEEEALNEAREDYGDTSFPSGPQERPWGLNGSTAAQMLIDTVDATGGLAEVIDDSDVPVGDEEWSDLASAYKQACKECGVEPYYSKRI